MTIPGPLAAALAAADEDYLIGLCNKGTVNRAKKDLAALAQPEATAEGDEMVVRLGDVVCRIRAPLGESGCSCPSSGICRHRIAAILWLRQQTGPDEGGGPTAASSDFAQLRVFPAEKLVRQLGAKRVADLLVRQAGGEGAAISAGGSTIVVELPWRAVTVRLLEPLEHSSCSCHSQSFCVHKAEALLAWQLQTGVTDPAALRALCPPEDGRDPEAVRRVCREVRQSLAAQLATGLSRLPPEARETVERLAALAHTAGLPSLERALRALHEEYTACFARSAAFRDSMCLARFGRAFDLAGALEAADEEVLYTLAGSFRDEYRPVGRLELYLLGLRAVAGRSGYEGTVYYFWEREAHRFYTYADLRPAYYEEGARRRKDTVLWKLPCTLRQAWNCALDLDGARVNNDGGLSSTGQCSAVLLGRQPPVSMVPQSEIYTDFSRLLAERSAPRAPERKRLALVRPARCEPQEYDRVRQTFCLRLVDTAGRDLWVEVRYKETEQAVVQTLERFAGRLRRRPDTAAVFFGSVYREGDRLKLYPIELFDDWEAVV